MFCSFAGGDDADYIIAESENDDYNSTKIVHTQRYMPNFVIGIDIFLPKQVVIFEYAYCIGKINSMLSEIAFSLSAMPFVRHNSS